MMMIVVAVALGAASPMPVIVQQGAQAGTQDGPIVPQALEPSIEAEAFAALYMPALLDRDSARMVYDRELQRVLKAEPFLELMGQQFPGLYDATYKASLDTLAEGYDILLARVGKKVAIAADAQLSTAELSAINAFIASPAAQAVLNSIVKNLVGDPLTNPLTLGAANTTQDRISNNMGFGFIGKFGEVGNAASAPFLASTTGRKFQAVLPTIDILIAEAVRVELALLQQKLSEASTTAMLNHFASAQPK